MRGSLDELSLKGDYDLAKRGVNMGLGGRVDLWPMGEICGVVLNNRCTVWDRFASAKNFLKTLTERLYD